MEGEGPGWRASEGGLGSLASPFCLVLFKKHLASITPFLPTGWAQLPPTLALPAPCGLALPLVSPPQPRATVLNRASSGLRG